MNRGIEDTCRFHLQMLGCPDRFKDAKVVIRTRESKKDRQHNVKKKRDKRTNNCLQNTTQTTNDRATRTRLKSVGELRCSGMVSSSSSTSGTCRVILVSNPLIRNKTTYQHNKQFFNACKLKKLQYWSDDSNHWSYITHMYICWVFYGHLYVFVNYY